MSDVLSRALAMRAAIFDEPTEPTKYIADDFSGVDEPTIIDRDNNRG